MDLAGLNALTAYQRCVIPPLHSPTDWALRSLSDIAFLTRRRRCEAAGPEKPEVYSLLGVRHLTQRI